SRLAYFSAGSMVTVRPLLSNWSLYSSARSLWVTRRRETPVLWASTVRLTASCSLRGVSSMTVRTTKPMSFLSSLWRRTFQGGSMPGGCFLGARLVVFLGLGFAVAVEDPSLAAFSGSFFFAIRHHHS